MPEREGLEGIFHHIDKIEAIGENASRNEPVPMSVDFSIFGAKPPNRPTINRYKSQIISQFFYK